ELARTSGRAVVPGDPDEGFAHLGVADLDRRPESGALDWHGDERALDAPRATTGNTDEELGPIGPERSARCRAPIGRSAVGSRREVEHRYRRKCKENGGECLGHA